MLDAMKEIFTHIDSARVGLFKSLLEEAGIGCFVRNEISTNMVTAVPIPALYPALCVVDDADFDRAVAILRDYQKVSLPLGGEWTCPHCQALVPASFDSCWKCERERSPS
ncbi:MAG: DUF2007 domain-containing protein [Terracidiphilus sp.]